MNENVMQLIDNITDSYVLTPQQHQQQRLFAVLRPH